MLCVPILDKPDLQTEVITATFKVSPKNMLQKHYWYSINKLAVYVGL